MTIEQKYLFPIAQKDIILSWLESFCLRDPDFSYGQVCSIYYDTPSFHLAQEKRNSDYLKTKVRLRWYEDEEGLSFEEGVNCFVEVKQKFGAIRQKHRIEVTLDSGKLIDCDLTDSEICSIPLTAANFIPICSTLLQPMLMVRYTRYRFIDTQTDSRISLDVDISAPLLNSVYFPCGVLSTDLNVGVLEVKGKHRVLPDALLPINHYLQKDNFSKYARCCQQLSQGTMN